MTPVDQNPFPSEWLRPRFQPTLSADEVHVWRAQLGCEPHELARLEAALSAEEKSRAERFVFPQDRQRFIAARGILRQLLSAYMNRSAAELEFVYGTHGKPQIKPQKGQLEVQFNVSHCKDLAVFAFAFRRQVGIDVEAIRPEFSGYEIAERFFSQQELSELRTLPPELQAQGFFLCWTRKEAYVKARGGGLQIPLDSFSVTLTPGRPEKLQSSDDSRWSLCSFQPAPGFVGAVIGEGKDWRLRRWEWWR
jgi:4'-phosphopantetheinyl transferase